MSTANTQSDEESASNPKRFKTEENEDNDEEVNEGPKITDINNDCLEHIFEHLNLKDLVNISDSSKHLKHATNLVFSRKYARKMIHLNIGCDDEHFGYNRNKVNCKNCNCLSDQKCDWFKIDMDEVTSCHPLPSFKLLRSFGHLMLTVHFQQYRTIPVYSGKLNRNYCIETLMDMSLLNPLKSIKIVQFSGGHVTGKLLNLNKWFPNMRQLTFSNGIEIIGCKQIVNHFQHLIHLSVEIREAPDDSYFGGENLAKLFILNPQLQSLQVSGEVTVEYLLKISEYLQNLQSLMISCRYEFFGSLDGGRIHFKNIKKFHIKYLTREIIQQIPITFNNLEELTMEINPRAFRSMEMYDNIFDFIQNQSSLVKLCCSFSHIFKVSGKNIMKMALPLLKEAYLTGIIVPADEVITFLDKCDLIEKFRFGVGWSERDKIESLLCSTQREWNFSKFRDQYELKSIN